MVTLSHLSRLAPFRRLEIEILAAAIFGDEIDPAAVRSPYQPGGRAVEIAAQRLFVLPINIHQVELGYGVGVVRFIVAGVGDQPTVGGDGWINIGSVAIG